MVIEYLKKTERSAAIGNADVRLAKSFPAAQFSPKATAE